MTLFQSVYWYLSKNCLSILPLLPFSSLSFSGIDTAFLRFAQSCSGGHTVDSASPFCPPCIENDRHDMRYLYSSSQLLNASHIIAKQEIYFAPTSGPAHTQDGVYC
jgi:hypothetical protein